VTAATLNAGSRGADGNLELRAQIVPHGPVALAERGERYDDQIDGSISLDVSDLAPATTEAPLTDLVALPHRRTEVANRLLLDLTHQFAVADLLQP
jgi:hypothetical protein